MPTILLALLLLAQPPAVAGVWTGTSVCLLGKPVCKDEHVVYHFAPAAGDSVTVTMNKLVNGAEEEMGVLTCAVTAREVVCPMPEPFRPGTWRFSRAAASLDGGLWTASGEQFREVHVRPR